MAKAKPFPYPLVVPSQSVVHLIQFQIRLEELVMLDSPMKRSLHPSPNSFAAHFQGRINSSNKTYISPVQSLAPICQINTLSLGLNKPINSLER
jgi:hypothetical protein